MIRFLSILCLFLVASCEQEKVIYYEYEFKNEAQIIVQGFISRKDGVQIHVSKLIPPDEIKANHYLPEAVVELYEDDERLFNLQEEDSSYFVSPPSFVPELGSKYHIEVSAPQMKTAVSANQKIEPAVQIDTAYITVIESPSLPGNNNLRNLFYVIDDPGNMNNHYDQKIYRYKGSVAETDSLFSGYELFNPYEVFSDSAFNGEKELRYKRKISINKYDWENDSIKYQYDSIKVELYSLSSSLAEFYKSMEEYEYTKNSPFFEHTVQAFSNIENGYGIFGAYAVDSIWIPIK